jgi:hypothetical protein
MNEKILTIIIVFLTVIIMGIVTFRSFKKENYCCGCKRHQKRKTK